MDELDLSLPQRQSVYGVVIIFFKRLIKAVNIFVSVLFVQIGVRGDSTLLIVMSMLAIMTVIFVLSYYYYLKFRFYVKDSEFIVERGILTKEKITIPFDRIQTVNIQQNIIQRLLSVSGVKVDTAGSASQEIEISALSKTHAKAIQSFLIEKKAESMVTETDTKVESLTQEDEKEPLLQLKFMDLIKIGLTENHLKTIAVFFALVNAYVWQFQDFLFGYAELVEEQYDKWLVYWAILLPIGIIAAFIIVILFSVFGSIMNFYNLKFTSDAYGVRIESGLLKRQEYQIPINKIQYLKWYKNPLRNWVGYRSIRIKQAGSEAVNKKASILVPACTEEHWKSITSDLFANSQEEQFTRIHPHQWFIAQLILMICIMPTVIFAAIAYFYPSMYLYSALIIYCPFSLLYAYQLAKRMSLDFNSEMLRINKGWLFNTQVILFQYKIQNVKIQQNIFQKRRGLAHLVLYTAAGRLKMWQLPHEVALQLYNQLLYKVESSKLRWM